MNVEHCSLSWAVDETASTWFNTVADVRINGTSSAKDFMQARIPGGLTAKAF